MRDIPTHKPEILQAIHDAAHRLGQGARRDIDALNGLEPDLATLAASLATAAKSVENRVLDESGCGTPPPLPDKMGA